MSSPWFRALVLPLSLPFLVPGNALRGETLVTTTAEAVLVEPTSYLVPTAYVPTSYVYPTTYAYYPTSYVSTAYTPTSYVIPAEYSLAPSSYVETTYYRRGLLGRWRPRGETILSYNSPALAYTPTVYAAPAVVAPTVSYRPTALVDTSVVAASTACCNPQPACCASSPAMVAPPARPSAPAVAPPSELSSVPSSVPENEPAPAPRPAPATAAPNPAESSGTPPTPAGPAPEPATPAVPAAPETPAAPASNNAVPPAAILPPADETIRHQAGRPVLPAMIRRNVLEGKVVASETRNLEEGVRVIVSSRTGAFADRTTTTNAYGRYALSVPNGDWTVKVQMPSGRVYAVSQITVSDGQITDNLGRVVPTLTITR